MVPSRSFDEIKESGLEFSIDSISVAAVDSSSYVNLARPTILRKHRLVMPMILSNAPHHQGAFSRL